MSKRAHEILIVDDDPSVRESIADFFEDRQWRTLQARSAEEALELVRAETPAAAIVDIRLPGISGDAFIRAVQELHPAMACVICTGSPEYAPPEDILALPRVSARVFTKPVPDMSEMLDAVRVLIEERGSEGRDSG